MVKMSAKFRDLESVGGLSERLNTVIMRGLSVNPEDRYRTCTEFVVEIETARNEEQAALEEQKRQKQENERERRENARDGG